MRRHLVLASQLVRCTVGVAYRLCWDKRRPGTLLRPFSTHQVSSFAGVFAGIATYGSASLFDVGEWACAGEPSWCGDAIYNCGSASHAAPFVNASSY
jgi:hypothetical protein